MRSGSFGINPYKDNLASPAITNWMINDFGTDKNGEWRFCLAGGALNQYDAVLITPLTASAAQLTTTLATGTTGPLFVGFVQTAVTSAD